VSVIIPTLNSERFLDRCLVSLQEQSYKKLEIIIVDDGSTDSTLKIAERYKCNIIKNHERGRAEAKNKGIQRSIGKYLLFADSDMELTPDLISECVSLVDSDPHIGGILIPEQSVGKSFWVKVRDFERSFYIGSIVESARFFLAKLVKEVGGYEEGLIFFEESTLPYKIQKRGYDVFARVNSMMVHHEENFSLFTWLKKKFQYGETMLVYAHKYRDYSRMQTNVWFRFSIFVKNWTKFLSRPGLALGVIVLKSLEYLAARLGSMYSKLR